MIFNASEHCGVLAFWKRIMAYNIIISEKPKYSWNLVFVALVIYTNYRIMFYTSVKSLNCTLLLMKLYVENDL